MTNVGGGGCVRSDVAADAGDATANRRAHAAARSNHHCTYRSLVVCLSVRRRTNGFARFVCRSVRFVAQPEPPRPIDLRAKVDCQLSYAFGT
jgi:hypothetical protein